MQEVKRKHDMGLMYLEAVVLISFHGNIDGKRVQGRESELPHHTIKSSIKVSIELAAGACAGEFASCRARGPINHSSCSGCPAGSSADDSVPLGRDLG